MQNQSKLKSPFPYFGGKSRVADVVWSRFGNVVNYVEPFFGSGAVLLARPHPPRTETVNDLDCYLSNFWRAIAADPDAVAHHADWPVNETDLHARHRWLLQRAEFRERMMHDPEHYDPQIAGWWVWGKSCWLGTGWCEYMKRTGDPSIQVPDLTADGRGIHRKLPEMRDGRGVHRESLANPTEKIPALLNGGQGLDVPQQIPHLQTGHKGINRTAIDGTAGLYDYFRALSERFRRVRVACGDFGRVLTSAVTDQHGITAVFLDPPYFDGCMTVYANHEMDTAAAAREWALSKGGDPLFRIALCGYDGEHVMPDDWDCVEWKAQGGYAQKGTAAYENRKRERIWFSPHCLTPGGGQLDLI